MCIIIYKPAGVEIRKELLKNAFTRNNDGFGLMYSEFGHVNVIKGLFQLDKILYLVKRHESKDLAIHMRHRTVGDVNKHNAHPFQVLDKHEHGMDLWLMHNGTFHSINAVGGKSDTVLFAEKLRHRILSGEFDIHNPEDMKRLEDEVMSYNKLLLMTGKGKVITLNKKSGHHIGQVWYSNQYSIQPPMQYVKVGNDYGTLGWHQSDWMD